MRVLAFEELPDTYIAGVNSCGKGRYDIFADDLKNLLGGYSPENLETFLQQKYDDHAFPYYSLQVTDHLTPGDLSELNYVDRMVAILEDPDGEQKIVKAIFSDPPITGPYPPELENFRF